MGGTQSEYNSPSGHIVNVMRQKYGKDSVEYLSLWSKKFGFPENGSLGKTQLAELREKLEKTEKDLRSKKTVKVTDLENIEKNKKCLIQWETESEYREINKLHKHLACVQIGVSERESDLNTASSTYNSFSAYFLSESETTGSSLLNTCPAHPPAYQQVLDIQTQTTALKGLTLRGTAQTSQLQQTEETPAVTFQLRPSTPTAVQSPLAPPSSGPSPPSRLGGFNCPCCGLLRERSGGRGVLQQQQQQGREQSYHFLQRSVQRRRTRGRGRSSYQQRDLPPNNDTCFRCGQRGHWARHCPQKHQQRHSCVKQHTDTRTVERADIPFSV